ncbi:MAG: hypothetical protein Fues2KO_04700 [Fuerstiella sp.]
MPTQRQMTNRVDFNTRCGDAPSHGLSQPGSDQQEQIFCFRRAQRIIAAIIKDAYRN